MKKRAITGIFYVVIMAGILVMKLLIPVAKNDFEYGAIGIDLLFCLIAAVGTYEFLRAVKDVSPAQKWVTVITCGLLAPSFVVTKMVTTIIGKADIPVFAALIVLLGVASVGAMIVASLTVFDHEKSDIKSTAYCELCILYCGGLTSVGVNINHFSQNSSPAILLLFLLCPMVDTGAFMLGSLLGKIFPAKLAPKTSPNKTVIGGVGGLLGGFAAAVVCWLICEFSSTVTFSYSGSVPSVVVLLLVSLPTSILAQLGDLFESAVKRGCNIKDMGNILPGHGGILDRFDSMLFATVPIAVCFLAI